MDFLQLVASRQSDRAYDMTRPVAVSYTHLTLPTIA